MISLHKRLFVILVAATGLIWLCAVGWIYAASTRELEHALDTRLQEAARMVNSLVTGGNGERGLSDAFATREIGLQSASYERQLSCQIWSLDGHLVARSSGAPDSRLTDVASGFSEQMVDGEPWRVYSIENAAKGVRVLVGDRLGLRKRLVNDLIKGLMLPAILMVPLLGTLIWVSLGRGLRPLRLIADDLKLRDADDMRPLDTFHAPTEIRPVAEALNGLFAKVETARRHERDVTAFAAHELRTPLAGLKTQAQVALATADSAIRDGALRHILVAVDRTTRLVRQLLTIARLEANPDPAIPEDCRIGVLLAEVVGSLQSASAPIRTYIDPALNGMATRANRELLLLVLRNLHENAIQHVPQDGLVCWGAHKDGTGFFVEDEGPGIAAEELALIPQRFFRGKHKTAAGSGLGLAIVEVASKQIGYTISYSNRRDRSGLRVTIATN